MNFALIPLLTYFSVSIVLAQVYNVRDFGAVGDGKTDDSKAIRNALAAAEKNNGGRVVLDYGYTFLSGCINVSSNVILDVQGTFLAQNDSAYYVLIEPLPWMGGGQDYENTGYPEWQSVIRSYNAKNITITGGGTIDGNGHAWWACTQTANTTYNRAPCWGKSSQNTDGIDIDCSVNVLVENVYYEGSDDFIAIKSGVDYLGRTFGRTIENVIIQNCSSNFSQGLGIGSEVAHGARNITFQNIRLNNAHFGVNIKNHRMRGGLLEDITYRDIYLSNTQYSIVLSLTYYLGSSAKIPPTNQSATPHFRNISTYNIYSIHGVYGWYLDGLAESVIKDVHFNNINISATHLIADGECHNIGGTCDNATVFPYCPHCITDRTCHCPDGGIWKPSILNPCNCYKVVEETTDWMSANNACVDQSSTLASIDTAFENQELVNKVKNSTCSNILIGLHNSNNVWSWVNNDTSTYRNWELGYPDNNSNNKCSQLSMKDGKWTNTDCSTTGCYVCEIKIDI